MGKQLSRTWSACSDPEGTANLVRRKKQQRAAINKYIELFDSIEAALDANDGQMAAENYQALKTFDRETDQRGLAPGDFRKQLDEHDDWPPLAARRQKIDSRINGC
eukprot:CAMPEP_0117495096 /NCGR_PEP_ID=MMETSP0784-20121206/19955_1 /TAXON_ID=39447 /ORGANISM="" /LENGTH=105 /DNA_ID=CAMNT_0005290005 /DNA_START=80 /DNA_END=397 /DNA_ORIENTATION=-